MSNPRLVALLGWPIGHSVSPPMQNAAFAARGLDWHFYAFSVAPAQLGDAVRGLAALGFAGANVTVPHKQMALSLADKVSPRARAVGAANTLVFGEDGIAAHNTDVQGFREAWTAAFGENVIVGKHACVIGAGGAARAVVAGLLEEKVCQITIVNRTDQRAETLLHDLDPLLRSAGVSARAADLDEFPDLLNDISALVQTTNVGMAPHVDEVLARFPSGWKASNLHVMDVVYNPRPTRFLREAAAAGAKTCDGLGMLIAQGARAFHLWTGQDAPVETMRQAAETALLPTGS